MSKIFIDTNILVYSLHSNDPKIKEKARLRLEELEKRGDGVISTQVMQEFYVVAAKKIGVDPILARKILQKFENFEVVAIVPRLIYEAIDCSVTAEISFWDALIIVAAQSAKCDTLWTEDLNPGQIIRDVRIINPLVSPKPGR